MKNSKLVSVTGVTGWQSEAITSHPLMFPNAYVWN